MLDHNSEMQRRINLYERKSKIDFNKESKLKEEIKFNIIGKSMTKRDEASDNALFDLALRRGSSNEDFKYYLKYSGFSKTARFY